jgi:hypothetical protein
MFWGGKIFRKINSFDQRLSDPKIPSPANLNPGSLSVKFPSQMP